MKNWKKCLALILTLCMTAGLAVSASAAGAETGLNTLPAGTYTYVDTLPAAEGDNGQMQFDYGTGTLSWAIGTQNGETKLSGDELEFFQSVYLSDRPVYDWLASAMRDTDGYAGNVAGNFLITLDDNGDISGLRLDSGLVQVTAAVSREITADTLTVSGATRGQPNLLHSCITLVGSANSLFLTAQGNVVLDNLTLGANANGVGFAGDKIGGDTFIAGTLYVDGRVEWLNRYANIQPVHADAPATLETNGQDIVMGGMNIGRVGRDLTLTTGADKGGDIIIGQAVSVDYGRGGPLADPSTGTLTLSTSGDLIAGKGNVVIGTNTERKVTINSIGNIQGANVTIAPTHNGVPSDVSGTIGNIDAAGKVEITLASVGGMGEISAKEIVKEIGAAEVESASAVPAFAALSVDGSRVELDSYCINGHNYFKVRDLAQVLSGTGKQFEVYWQDNMEGTTMTLTSGRAYTPNGSELAAPGTAVKEAVPGSWSVYLDSKQVSIASYVIDGVGYFKLRDLAKAMDFATVWDGASGTIMIDTAAGYAK